MICYRDMAFCSTPDCPSFRALTSDVKAAADRWWGQTGAPIAVGDFHANGACDCTPAADRAEHEGETHGPA